VTPDDVRTADNDSPVRLTQSGMPVQVRVLAGIDATQKFLYWLDPDPTQRGQRQYALTGCNPSLTTAPRGHLIIWICAWLSSHVCGGRGMKWTLSSMAALSSDGSMHHSRNRRSAAAVAGSCCRFETTAYS
jgi:hypothetical protein